MNILRTMTNLKRIFIFGNFFDKILKIKIRPLQIFVLTGFNM